jgi:hypothetical protein
MWYIVIILVRASWQGRALPTELFPRSGVIVAKNLSVSRIPFADDSKSEQLSID